MKCRDSKIQIEVKNSKEKSEQLEVIEQFKQQQQQHLYELIEQMNGAEASLTIIVISSIV